ncbi:MAG: DEAD/DEAH box helicase [Parcubacteria group bacterium]|nr:DEAD/DEAH box helicase [Parcubacteria group bacterium]
MEQDAEPRLAPGDVSGIAEKLKSKLLVVIKTPTNPVSQSFVLAHIIKESDVPESPVLVVARDSFAQLNLVQNLRLWLARYKTKVAIHTDTLSAALSDVLANRACLLVLTTEHLNTLLPSASDFKKRCITLSAGQTLKREALLKQLIEAGYTKERAAASHGLVASRGSIVDIYPPDQNQPVRIDFDDETIESITAGTPVKSIRIIPYSLSHREARATLFDYNPGLKQILFDAFPANPDATFSFANRDIQELSAEILPAEEAKKPKPAFLKKLQVDDFVVHLDHGIAKFSGMVQHNMDGIMREYFKLSYAEGDTLFLPVTAAEKMEKYIGDQNPGLTRLSGSGWSKVLQKASLETLAHARELLNTQAKRQLSAAPSIPNAVKVQKELAESFPYKETEDQKAVIKAIYQDLSQETPMDRLVCGDVGFGKTEVAIRAAAKAALSGFQVAVLSPTTILTQQHVDTFTERLKGFPITLAGLSRFETAREQARTLEGIAKGIIDIVIGTHRMLSSDVVFHNLGLIIIDEEQRFGVSHKEQLKKLRSQAHVLTLTATPIPRTLHLGLSGIRAVSVITTPPEGRKPIETIIEPHNQKHVQAAIEAELKRKGQVYYLYNNVETMQVKLQELQSLMPKVKFGMLHGQLPEEAIAKVMHQFDAREIDVLVCSTIIENGLDLPNVNTLIVDNAVLFGLSQLHQIRGRIGRGNRQAYAYFFFKRQKLTGEAEKRLQALEEARALGSGFDLAQRDMEIRGVGNVLGKAQHGHVKSIGLGLYVRLLASAVEEIKSGKPQETLSDISVDLPVEARIPQFFEPNREKRIELYHEWALIDSLDELAKTRDELQKQGALPQALSDLFYILKLKLLGRAAGIRAIDTAVANPSSSEQIFILKTEKPIQPKRFAAMLGASPHWLYSEEELRAKKADLGSDWKEKLEKSIASLTEN